MPVSYTHLDVYKRQQVEGAQNGETAIGFTDPTKAAKTGGEE